MMKQPIRIVVADDHSVLREALARQIDGEPDMSVVGQASDGLEAMEKIRLAQPDVLVIDISMPKCTGIATIEWMRNAFPSVRALVLTMHEEQQFIQAVLSAGGAGYVTKRAASSDLLQAIRTVHDGRAYINVNLSGGSLMDAVSANTPTADSEVQGLSQRQRDVLLLVAHGHTSKEIATRLRITRASVDTYRQRLGEKLGLKGRADLVRFAIRAGLLAEKSES